MNPVTTPRTAPADPHLQALPPVRQFALWAVRVWVEAHRRPVNLLPALRDGFAAARMPGGWLALDNFMTLFLGMTRRRVEVRSIGCPSVSGDEIGLLEWLAAAQRAEAPGCNCPNGQRVIECLMALAACFTAAGLVLDSGPAGSLHGPHEVASPMRRSPARRSA